MPSKADETLAESPKDPVTGQATPRPRPSERAGTEVEERAGGSGAPKPAGETRSPAGQANRAFRSGDA